jgi:hypothetical protein
MRERRAQMCSFAGYKRAMVLKCWIFFPLSERGKTTSTGRQQRGRDLASSGAQQRGVQRGWGADVPMAMVATFTPDVGALAMSNKHDTNRKMPTVPVIASNVSTDFGLCGGKSIICCCNSIPASPTCVEAPSCRSEVNFV